MRLCFNCKCEISSLKKVTAKFCTTNCKNNYYDSRRSGHRRLQFSAHPLDIDVKQEIILAKKQKQAGR